MIRRIEAVALKALIHSGRELALIDVREHGQYGEGHLFYAVSMPYSRLELELARLVPRKTVQVVLVDEASARVAERARLRMLAVGYHDVLILDGGIEAWQAAGYQCFAGVNVPSKAFGEIAEAVFHTPHLSARDLHARLASGESMVVIDGRPLSEHQKMHIPGARCCPNGELALRIHEIVPDPKTTVVLHCAGRTRSIIGAQTLIKLGLPNPVYALENGTQGWALAGFALEHGPDRRFAALPIPSPQAPRVEAAKVWSEQLGIVSIDMNQFFVMQKDSSRTTLLCDVRTAEEFAQGRLADALHTPGGQLIQATDQFIAVRGARLVLYDSDNLRAKVVACWLHLLGWEVYVLKHAERFLKPDVLTQSREYDSIDMQVEMKSKVLTLGDTYSSIKARTIAQAQRLINSQTLADRLLSEPRDRLLLIDVRPSMSFRRAHLSQAVWSIRPRLESLLETFVQAPAEVILLAEDLGVAELAALECEAWFAARKRDPLIFVCTEGPAHWEASGLRLMQSASQPSDSDCIDYLFFTHDRHDGNLDAARQYLAWELALTQQIDQAERAAFRL